MLHKVKRMPLARATQKKHRQNKEYIMAVLEISEDEYNTIQFNVAITWIKATIWEDELVVSALTNDADFWRWWLNQWNICECAFMAHYLDYMIHPLTPIAFLRKRWNDAHATIGGCLPDFITRKVFKKINQKEVQSC